MSVIEWIFGIILAIGVIGGILVNIIGMWAELIGAIRSKRKVNPDHYSDPHYRM